jgi:hypothetical protein
VFANSNSLGTWQYEVTVVEERVTMRRIYGMMTDNGPRSTLGHFRGLLGVRAVAATLACTAAWADSAPSVAPAPTADLATRVAALAGC